MTECRRGWVVEVSFLAVRHFAAPAFCFRQNAPADAPQLACWQMMPRRRLYSSRWTRLARSMVTLRTSAAVSLLLLV